MQLEHQFSVPAPLDVVWQAVIDPERVAPCMPGATLTEVNGAEFAGTVKVKLGPVSLLYKGTGEFLERDEAAHRVVIKASGKDSRGNGTAAATVTVTLTANGDQTDGAASSDVNVTGRPAQFGRGMISEVGGKILNAFVACLADKLGTEEPAPDAPPSAPHTPQEAPTAPPADAESRPRPRAVAPVPDRPEAEPIDLAAFAGGSVLKRLAPVAAVLAALIAFIVLRRRRT
ncbi:MAG: SRPBCC family protein [Sciscionella sp.]